MATSKSTGKSSAAPAKRKTPKKGDAYALLKADHAEVKECFKAYQELVDTGDDADGRRELAQQICLLLTVHATVEEEIFYPAAREALGEEADLIDEADVEHASAKELIAMIRDGDPDDDYYDARVKVLGEYVDHHVKEEEGEMFRQVKKAGLDAEAVGEEMAMRKEELMEEMGAEEGATGV